MRELAPVPDKLRVFVSSTISECAKERQIAKAAIQSLNHELFLFEEAGARPYPPRELYSAKLDSAHIFVAIYKHSYGWIAPGEAISGLEDEYRQAMKRGMPCLVYIHSESGPRQEKLNSIIAEIQREAVVTYAKYSEATELYDKIRNDLEAVVAQRFVRAEQLESVFRRDAVQEVLTSLRGMKGIVPRPGVLKEVIGALNVVGVVQLVGEPGAGKTTFLASTAAENGFAFIAGAYLSPLELTDVILRKLRPPSSADLPYHLNVESAQQELRQVWTSLPTCTVVIDGLDNAAYINQLIRTVGGATRERRILYSVRHSEAIPGHTQVFLPPFTRAEVEALLRLDDGEADDERAESVLKASGGNPLLLRYLLDSNDSNLAQGLTEFELAHWQALPPRSKELVSYIAISQSRLSLAMLMQLADVENQGPEGISNDLRNAEWFLSDDSYGFAMRHDHQRGTILDTLSGSPQKRGYYARRLADLLRRQGDYVSAFYALEYADDPDALRIARAAVFDLSRKGDFRRLEHLFAKLVAAARGEDDPEDLARFLLGLSETQQYLGRSAEAAVLLGEAQELVSRFSLGTLGRQVKEVMLWREATRTWSAQSIESLYALRDEYRANNDLWSYGRVTLEITALLLRGDDPSRAEAVAREAEAAFNEIGDKYGVSLARRNLAMALSAAPGREAELQEILREFRYGAQNQRGKRERAWLCNLMVRRLRREKRLEEAETHAKEAIEIGLELGDGYVVAINQLNLGNVYRDGNRLQDALKEYQECSSRAKGIGDLELEATASRVASSVYLQLGERTLAVQYASFAVGLLRGSAASSQLIDCLEQLGDSYDQDRTQEDAAHAYVEGALVAKSADNLEEGWRLGAAGLHLLARVKHYGPYLSAMDQLCGLVTEDASVRKSVLERLYRRTAPLLSALIEDFTIRIMGTHFRLMLEDLPAPVAQFVFEEVSKDILDSPQLETWRTVLPLIPLLTALPGDALTLKDTVKLGEMTARAVDSLHYKPRGDSSPHWVVGLHFREPVICSISGLDAEVDTAIVSTTIALFLKAFETDIQNRIIGQNPILRREVHVGIGTHSAMPHDLSAHLGITKLTVPCTVAQPVDRAENIPVYMILKTGITKDWARETDGISGLNVVLSTILAEIIFAVFRHELELDVLMPKVMKVVSRAIS